MKYDPVALDVALAAAVGDNPMLVAELRSVFMASARNHADALARAAGGAEWRDAAMRLHGLAASFGAIELMLLADRTGAGPVGDSASLANISSAIEALAA